MQHGWGVDIIRDARWWDITGTVEVVVADAARDSGQRRGRATAIGWESIVVVEAVVEVVVTGESVRRARDGDGVSKRGW